MVVRGASRSAISSSVAVVDEAGIVFFSPLGRDCLSILISIVEHSPKAVVNGSIPGVVIVAGAVSCVVSL